MTILSIKLSFACYSSSFPALFALSIALAAICVPSSGSAATGRPNGPHAPATARGPQGITVCGRPKYLIYTVVIFVAGRRPRLRTPNFHPIHPPIGCTTSSLTSNRPVVTCSGEHSLPLLSIASIAPSYTTNDSLALSRPLASTPISHVYYTRTLPKKRYHVVAVSLCVINGEGVKTNGFDRLFWYPCVTPMYLRTYAIRHNP